MTAADNRKFKRMLIWLPAITVMATVLVTFGTWQANSVNIKEQFQTQKIETEKRFERIEREKVNADLVNSKFNDFDWKLNLIMDNLGIKRPAKRDTI